MQRRQRFAIQHRWLAFMFRLVVYTPHSVYLYALVLTPTANNAHEDSLGAISFMCPMVDRVSFVLHTGSVNSYATTSKLKHL